ncbi:alpha/beta hydrolase [Mycolicibacterium sp. P9-64]|uniref:alpha/beta hydrolase n=1 Tax=Mycolicibacterium sp. P9-64 TaxID=2024612 RepID=UPI0011EC4B22|nr:alpha/beta hydrolase [Mycolicibacterium sp. P9-64]KAA0083392.1 alpha/beta hydrolase [Mycolicibacterium sp. P9-64]
MNCHEQYASTAGFHLGNADAPEVLVLLHGLGADHKQPLDLITGVDTDGFTVLAPDVRAHGESLAIGEPADFRFDSLVHDLRALMDRLGQVNKPAHIVGISMGAAVALRTALSPDFCVRSLTLIRPAFTDVPLPRNLRVMADIGELLGAGADTSAARVQFAESQQYRDVAAISPLAGESLLRQFDAPLAVARSVRLRSVPRNRAYARAQELASISVSTLVIGTENDPVHPYDLARKWSYAIPDAQFATVPPRDRDPVATSGEQRERVGAHLASVKATSWT